MTLNTIERSLQNIERQLERLVEISETEREQKAKDRELIENVIVAYGQKMNERGGIHAHYICDEVT